jgi:hypothetical protein
MGSEMQKEVMRVQKRKIQISTRHDKNLIFSVKKCTFSSFYMELEVFFNNYSANLFENML